MSYHEFSFCRVDETLTTVTHVSKTQTYGTFTKKKTSYAYENIKVLETINRDVFYSWNKKREQSFFSEKKPRFRT